MGKLFPAARLSSLMMQVGWEGEAPAEPLQQTLDAVVRQRKRLAELDPLITFRATLQALEEARWWAASLDCRAAATQLTWLASQVK